MINDNQPVEQYIVSINSDSSFKNTQYTDSLIEKTNNYLKTPDELVADDTEIDYVSKKAIKCKRYKLYKTRKY